MSLYLTLFFVLYNFHYFHSDFIGLDSSNLPEFPHTNKGENAAKFVEDIYKDTEYEKGFIKDLDDYFKQFGLTISMKKENKAPRII